MLPFQCYLLKTQPAMANRNNLYTAVHRNDIRVTQAYTAQVLDLLIVYKYVYK